MSGKGVSKKKSNSAKQHQNKYNQNKKAYFSLHGNKKHESDYGASKTCASVPLVDPTQPYTHLRPEYDYTTSSLNVWSRLLTPEEQNNLKNRFDSHHAKMQRYIHEKLPPVIASAESRAKYSVIFAEYIKTLRYFCDPSASVPGGYPVMDAQLRDVNLANFCVVAMTIAEQFLNNADSCSIERVVTGSLAAVAVEKINCLMILETMLLLFRQYCEFNYAINYTCWNAKLVPDLLPSYTEDDIGERYKISRTSVSFSKHVFTSLPGFDNALNSSGAEFVVVDGENIANNFFYDNQQKKPLRDNLVKYINDWFPTGANTLSPIIVVFKQGYNPNVISFKIDSEVISVNVPLDPANLGIHSLIKKEHDDIVTIFLAMYMSSFGHKTRAITNDQYKWNKLAKLTTTAYHADGTPYDLSDDNRDTIMGEAMDMS